eukprot:gene23825-biopygen18327
MGDPMFGSFAIPDGGPHAQAFREAYVHALRDEGRPMSIVEAHTDTSPVIVDLDMRQTTPERSYTQKHIENFMDALVAATKYFVDQQHMDIVILEKPNPRLDKKHLGVYKDGLHVFMPNVITHPEIQLAIREHFVNDVTEHMAFSSTICIPGLAEMDPGKIYDESVIKRGGRWFLYGSKKPDEAHPWKVTAWYQFDIAAGSFAKRDVQQMDLDTLVQNLSIRVHPKGGHSPYTKHGQEEMVIRGDDNLSEPKKTFDSHHGMDVESLYNLVDILDAHRASGYDSWLKIGMALKNTVDTGTDTQRLEIWKAFAKKCPSKFSDTNHEKVWANLKPQKITLGTLCFLAKEDDPMGYAEWIRQWDTNDNKLGVKLDKDRIIKDLKVKLINLHIDNMILLDVVHDSIEFNMENGAKGAIHKNQYMVEVDDKYYGSLIDKFPIHEDPGFMKNVPSDKGPYECELRTMDGKTISSAIVKSTDVQIALMNMGSESQYVNVQSITCNACKIRDKQVINTIHNMIFKAQESHAKNMYGITQNIFLVNNTINIHIGGGDVDSLSSSSITEDVLAEKFMEASPEFFSRIKFVPEIKKKECVGDMYYCDPATNCWSNCSNMMISKLIKKVFTSTFPVDKKNKTNEKLRWFVDTVMPVDEERDVVLAFFAGLLSGRRKEKKFLAFTDKTSGDNGKSTLMALMGNFLVEYGSSNGTKFLAKGSFARGRDDHDAGLKPMKGWKSGIADSANPLPEWLEEVVEVTGASSDAVWIGDLKIRWKESHYGHEASFSTKLVKAFFAGKQGTEWKETARMETKGKGEVNNKNSNIWDLSSRGILTRGGIAMVMIVVTIAIAVGIRGLFLAKDRDIVAVTLQQSDDAGKELGNIKTADKRSVLTRLIALMAFWGVLGDFLSGVLIATFEIYRIGNTIQVKDVIGIVVDFRLLHTVLRDFHTYAYITIPNNTIYNNVTTNLSLAKNKWMHVNVKLTNVASGGFKEDVPDVSFVRRIIINDLLNPTKKENNPDVDFTRINADILGKYKENGAGGVQVVVFDMTNFGTDVRIVYPVVKPSTFYAQMRLNTRVRQILSDHNVGLAFQG